MKNAIHIQSREGRLRAINQFCNITGVMACIYVFILFGIGFRLQACVMILTSASFFSCTILNKKGFYSLSKVLVITFTNFAVFYFSVLLGFKIGIHLYLFTAPLIAYLLFDFNAQKKIILTSSIYIINYLIIFLIQRFNLVSHALLPESTENIIYVINFSFSLILCFTLIIYFANNNTIYVKKVEEVNNSLEEKQSQLQNEIHEKNILLSEIHHRVKNNLAIISGLIELQNFYVKDEKASSILKESSNRIKSIALLHEKFYTSKTLEKIEMRSYIDELIHFIKTSFSAQDKEVKIHSEIESVELFMVDALPFSLLLNELITNSYKHAFNIKKKGNIHISLIKRFDEYILRFKDDGDGFDFSGDSKEKTLGLNLIEAFSKQLKGELSFSSVKGAGTELKLRFNR
jgi:two-component sensor histidine kinase